MREVYAVRNGLDESRLDLPIPLSSSDMAFSINREVTVKTFVFGIMAVAVYVVSLLKTPLLSMGFLGLLLTTLGYFWIIYLMIGVTEDNRTGYNMVGPMINYMDSKNRHIETRASSKLYPTVNQIGGVASYNENHGVFLFENGDLGKVYELSGNASVLAFSQDLASVIDSVRVFYNSLSSKVSITFDSLSGPQRVVEQVRGKDDQILDLDDVYNTNIHNGNADPYTYANNPIRNLLYTKRDILQNFVGEDFQSLRQYMVVRAVNRDEMEHFDTWLHQFESMSGDTFVKGVRELEYDELVKYFKNTFSAQDIH